MFTAKNGTGLLVLTLAVAVHRANSFTIPTSTTTGISRQLVSNNNNARGIAFKSNLEYPFQIPRGGDETELKMAVQPASVLADILYPSLQSGPYGVLALTAVAAAAVVPLTLYKQIYSISVGYGMAIFFIAVALQLAFAPATAAILSSCVGQTMIGALMFYGLRLASYLLLREATRKTPPAGGMKQSPLLQRLPLALSVSLFYAFLAAPALYTLRHVGDLVGTNLVITKAGIGLAIFGAVLEAVADFQKYLVKQSAALSTKKDQFVGPTGFSYRAVRHPNYLGEILFWLGVFIGGVPSFGRSVIAWVSSILGLYGIIMIMTKATARLEGQQQDKYSGQEKYDTWTKKVKSPLFPFF